MFALGFRNRRRRLPLFLNTVSWTSIMVPKKFRKEKKKAEKTILPPIQITQHSPHAPVTPLFPVTHPFARGADGARVRGARRAGGGRLAGPPPLILSPLSHSLPGGGGRQVGSRRAARGRAAAGERQGEGARGSPHGADLGVRLQGKGGAGPIAGRGAGHSSAGRAAAVGGRHAAGGPRSRGPKGGRVR